MPIHADFSNPTALPPAKSRAAAAACNQILQQLKDDHKSVEKAYQAFLKLDRGQDHEAMQAIVEKVLDELTIHAALEEELLYPAARAALSDHALVDEAEVEHESMKAFIEQLRGMSPGDDKYCARFTVLCEYVLHHVKEEEGEMFSQLEKARLDWDSLAVEMNHRRAEMNPEDEDADPVGDGHAERADEDESADDSAPGVSSKPLGDAAHRKPVEATAPPRKRPAAQRSQSA